MNKQKFGKWALRRLKWSTDDGKLEDKKCILLGVPHTSIWDFVISWLYASSIGITANIMIKKEFFFWPLGGLLKSLGAIPVDRTHGAVTARSVIERLKNSDTMYLAIAPEGTRKKTRRWKTGFHTIARECNVPIYLGYFDWKNKRVGKGVRFIPTNDSKEDLQKIMAHYAWMEMDGLHKDCFDAGDIKKSLNN